MKILSVEKIREADAFTIANEPIASEDLMERAGQNCVDFIARSLNPCQSVKVFSGPGNNGGDGLVIARYLQILSFDVEVFIVDFTTNYSKDFANKLDILKKNGRVKINHIASIEDIPILNNEDAVVDAIFGSGLNRPVKGLPGEVIKSINNANSEIFSIDIASGLFADNYVSPKDGEIVRATHTLSLEFPKMSMMMPENERFVGEMHVISIGLHPNYIQDVKPEAVLLEKEMIKGFLRIRSKFEHKGSYGHALLIAGSFHKTGAAILASGACLRTGAGLLTAHIPEQALLPLQSKYPEVMMSFLPWRSLVIKFQKPSLCKTVTAILAT